MSRRRLVCGILFLCIGIGILAIYVWGMLLTAAVDGMLSATGKAATKSTNLFAQLAPAGTIIFVAIALWLLLGPSTQKLFTSLRRGRRDR